MTNEEGGSAEKLMGALISKMESMDGDLQTMKQENMALRKSLQNPHTLLKRAGFVSARNNLPQDVLPDEFRGDDILKGYSGEELAIPKTNEDFHEMNWEDIHALAGQAKSQGRVGNEAGME